MKAARKRVSSLAREEWDFWEIPEHEIEVCRLWEYARESTTIRRICEETRAIAEAEMDGEERNEKRKEFYRLFDHLRRSSILFQEGIYCFGGTESYLDFKTPFPQPWQTLSAAQKAILIETAAWDARTIVGMTTFRRAPHASAHALVHHFQPKSLAEVFGKAPTMREVAHAGHRLRAVCPNWISKCGTETMVVEIEWANRSNDELQRDFAQWLVENRPPEWPSPKRRGRKRNDLRASLSWLGIARLLHQSTPQMAEKLDPLVVRRLGKHRNWHRDRNKAAKVFQELFPFLPANEFPLCWPTIQERVRIP